jgi:hypothetical protein
MRSTKRQTEAVRAYVEDQAYEEVVHIDKAASELVGPVWHDIWDAHCPGSRWWVIAEPTNLYSQEDSKSRDVALTFHIGLSMSVAYLHDRRIPVELSAADLLAGTWRRWEQAFEASYGTAVQVRLVRRIPGDGRNMTRLVGWRIRVMRIPA